MTIETLKLITAALGLLTVLLGGVFVLMRKISGVHLLINSRMDELLEATRKNAHAEGVKEGRDRPSSRDES